MTSDSFRAKLGKSGAALGHRWPPSSASDLMSAGLMRPAAQCGWVQIPIFPPYKIKPLETKVSGGFFVVPYFFIIPSSASSSSALAIALR